MTDLRELIIELFSHPPRSKDCPHPKEHFDPRVTWAITCRDCFADQILTLLESKEGEEWLKSKGWIRIAILHGG